MNYKQFTLITDDSRKVIPGALFVAVKGFSSDGHDYIANALEKGATGIICERIPDQVRNDAMAGVTGHLNGNVEF